MIVKHILVRYVFFEKSIKKTETDVLKIISIVAGIIQNTDVPVSIKIQQVP